MSGDDEGPRHRKIAPGELAQLAVGRTARSLGERVEGVGLSLVVDSELPIGAGFGSSAALAVAIPAALFSLFDESLDPGALSAMALDVERFQHGLPSGIDNTAVLTGGLLWAQHAHGSGTLECRALRHRSGLLDRVRVYHSGTPAETTGRVVAKVRERLARDAERCKKALRDIDASTRQLELQLVRPGFEAAEVVRLVRRCEAALEALGVVPEATAEIIRRVEAAGGAAKISGAGALTGTGAGSVLLFHPEPEVVDDWDFIAPWRRLPVTLPSEGLTWEERV